MNNSTNGKKDVYKQYSDSNKHKCEISEDFKIEKKPSLNEIIKAKDKDNYKLKARTLPFGIKATELNKYMVYGEILGTPVCKKNRKAY